MKNAYSQRAQIGQHFILIFEASGMNTVHGILFLSKPCIKKALKKMEK